MTDLYCMIPDEDALIHYGIKFKSGRYPYGSGENPYQHDDRYSSALEAGLKAGKTKAQVAKELEMTTTEFNTMLKLEKAANENDAGFRGLLKDAKDNGISEKEVAKYLGMPVAELRNRMHVEKVVERNAIRQEVLDLYNSGVTNYTEIGRQLGLGDTTVASLLDPVKDERNNISINTAKILTDEVSKYGPTIVGKGVANRLGISETALERALFAAEMNDGYHVYNGKIHQVGTGHETTIKVLCPPDMSWSTMQTEYLNKGAFHVVDDPYSEDGGRTWEHIEPPRSIDAKRIKVVTRDEGGLDRDGLIEIRPGVEDLDMGTNQYAQVRIAVDGTHYLKGMALYNPDLPKGVDVVVYSNKPAGKEKKDYFKTLKDDPENPFGAKIHNNEYDDEGNLVREIGQRHYIDSNGKKQLSAINIVNEPGDWDSWKKTLASQMLSKQSTALASQQLNLAYDKRVREFDEIMALENPTLKKKLLDTFAEECESAAETLRGAPLPGQKSHVILPFPSIKETEIYAPNYPNGSIVSLIRYPHGGTFEIPTLKVNNRNPDAKALLGNAVDAVGVNKVVADQLSGADFDGDTVLVIPNPNGKLINSRPALEELKNFETSQYARDKFPDGENDWPVVKDDPMFVEQTQMGKVSNLITDMTIKGATDEELARAIRHSMVVIDAEKHDLNWRQSEADNGIKELKIKYQGGANRGASTIFSRASSDARVPEKKLYRANMIDPETGEIDWYAKDSEGNYKNLTNRYIKSKNPETGEYEVTNKLATQKTTKMRDVLERTGTAQSLSSGNKMEQLYVDYADKVHQLANKARKEMVNTKDIKKDPEASKKYAGEVASLKDKVNRAMANKPLENKAQALAAYQLRLWKEDNPDASKDDIKKHSGLFLTEARQRMGASKYRIKITDKEWEAIQANAITAELFRSILQNTDTDQIRQLATPRDYTTKLSANEIAMAKRMASGNYTQAEIADYLGVSVSTINGLLNT